MGDTLNDTLNDGVQALAKSLEAEGKQVLIVAVTLEDSEADDGTNATVALKGFLSKAAPSEAAALMVGVHNQLSDILTFAAGRWL